MLDGLHYVGAKDVGIPASTFGHLVEAADGAPLGRLEGFLVDPVNRRICFLVIGRRTGWRLRRLFVPFVPAMIDRVSQRLQLLAPAEPTQTPA